MLSVHELEVEIAGIPILNEVTLDLRAQDIAGLIGRNGAGKTTLMRAVMGVAQSRRGAVSIDGVDVTRAPGHRRAQMGIG